MSSIQEDVEEEPVTFFDPSSPYYLATMYASAAGLAVFLCCGILYQALCYNKISGTNSKLTGLQYSCDCNTSLDLYPLQRLVYSRSLCEGERSLSAREQLPCNTKQPCGKTVFFLFIFDQINKNRN